MRYVSASFVSTLLFLCTVNLLIMDQRDYRDYREYQQLSDNEENPYPLTPAPTDPPSDPAFRTRHVTFQRPVYGTFSTTADAASGMSPIRLQPPPTAIRLQPPSLPLPNPVPPASTHHARALEHDVNHVRTSVIPAALPRKKLSFTETPPVAQPLSWSEQFLPDRPPLRDGQEALLDRVRDGSRLSTIDLATLARALASTSDPQPPRRTSRSPPRRSSTKLQPYDGVSKPQETFLARFENFSSHYRWEEEERLFQLRNSLAKTVGNVLWDSGSPSSSVELISLLRSRYGSENQADRFRMELKRRRRQTGESLQSLRVSNQTLQPFVLTAGTEVGQASMGRIIFCY